MPSSEDSSSSRVVLWMQVRPPDQTKQCNGTCGLSKPQSDYAFKQWMKKEKGDFNGDNIHVDSSGARADYCSRLG
jgi:hypothetical protein